MAKCRLASPKDRPSLQGILDQPLFAHGNGAEFDLLRKRMLSLSKTGQYICSPFCSLIEPLVLQKPPPVSDSFSGH